MIIIIILCFIIILLLFIIIKKSFYKDKSIIISIILNILCPITLMPFSPKKIILKLAKILLRINGNYGGWEYEIESLIHFINPNDEDLENLDYQE